jgi:hypothetical protein
MAQATATRLPNTCRRPTPINLAAASTVSRLSNKSFGTRSRVSSRSLISITVIARHPERLDDSLSSDISIGDASDISIGDLHPRVGDGPFW